LSTTEILVSRGYGPDSHWFISIEKMVRGTISGKTVDQSDGYGESLRVFADVKDIAKGIILVHLADVFKYMTWDVPLAAAFPRPPW
jgi:hypothetical protein